MDCTSWTPRDIITAAVVIGCMFGGIVTTIIAAWRSKD